MSGRVLKGLAALTLALLLLGAAALLHRPRSAPAPAEKQRAAPPIASVAAVRGSLAKVDFAPAPAANSTASEVIPELAPILLHADAPPTERQVEAIAHRTDVPDRLKARALLQMLPALPEEAMARAAEEAVRRLPDADYTALVGPMVLDPGTHGMAMSVLFADLMERPDGIALPTLFAIARNARHPFAPSARKNLELLLGRNLGDDWAAWEAEIRRRLAPPTR